MTNLLDGILDETLKTRQDRGLLRGLAYDAGENEEEMIDFSSNDYLGLANSVEVEKRIKRTFFDFEKCNKRILGSTGSRLLSGDSKFAKDLENYLLNFHEAESALLFNSGFDANLSLMATLPQKNSIVLYDELVHNSCREGLKLSRCDTQVSFQHNDVSNLSKLLEEYKNVNLKIIVIESVYSMDGHIAPLKEICDLAEATGSFIIVDEAHGTGIIGKGGRGLCQHLNESKRVFARVHTFGKALGCHGAVIVGSKILRSYLINYARPLIYSTSLPMHSLINIKCAYEEMELVADKKQVHLTQLILHFRQHAVGIGLDIAESFTPIQAIFISGNEAVKKVCEQARKNGFSVFPIRAPTVPEGKERIRVVLHDFNTVRQVEQLVVAIHCFIMGDPITKPVKDPKQMGKSLNRVLFHMNKYQLA